jgi:hypothetical protein
MVPAYTAWGGGRGESFTTDPKWGGGSGESLATDATWGGGSGESLATDVKWGGGSGLSFTTTCGGGNGLSITEAGVTTADAENARAAIAARTNFDFMGFLLSSVKMRFLAMRESVFVCTGRPGHKTQTLTLQSTRCP